MAESLQTVMTFINNADEHAAFLERVQVALFEEAISLRETPESPMTEEGFAAQEFALAIISSPVAQAKRMLPALAIKANEAGLIDAQGVLTGTDSQIRGTVAGLMDEFSSYIPAVP